MRCDLPCFATFIALAIASPAVSAGEHDALFERLDANRDGLIARGEIDPQKIRLFERLLRQGDDNADGRLTLEEFNAGLNPPEAAPPRLMRLLGGMGGMPGMAGGIEPQWNFAQWDRNGDGRLARNEAPPRLRQNFDRADADGDGSLDRREFFRAMARQAGSRAPRQMQRDN